MGMDNIGTTYQSPYQSSRYFLTVETQNCFSRVVGGSFAICNDLAELFRNERHTSIGGQNGYDREFILRRFMTVNKIRYEEAGSPETTQSPRVAGRHKCPLSSDQTIAILRLLM